MPIVDWIGTIGLAALMAWGLKMPFELALTIALVLGILGHFLFGVQTSTMKYIGI